MTGPIIREVTIGNCRLIQGDCLEVMPLLGKVDAVVTDPPYGIGFEYPSYDDTRENLRGLVAGLFSFRDLFTRMIILCGPSQVHVYPESDWLGCITWNTTGSFGKYGYSQWTPVLLYGDDLKGFGNVNGVTKTDTYQINGGGSVGFQRDPESKLHVCPKPMNIMNRMVQRYTGPDETILDPFCGSGSTGVAAAHFGRAFIGIERDADYFDICVKRITDAHRQADLFVAKPAYAAPVQEGMDL